MWNFDETFYKCKLTVSFPFYLHALYSDFSSPSCVCIDSVHMFYYGNRHVLLYLNILTQ